MHADSETLAVSSDVAVQIRRRALGGPLLEVFRELVGETFGPYLVSPAYAERHGLADGETVAVGEEFPEWLERLVPTCAECLHDARVAESIRASEP